MDEKTRAIVLVEDEDALVRLGEGMLTRLGYEVVAHTMQHVLKQRAQSLPSLHPVS